MAAETVCESVCDAIGATPLVRLARLDRDLPGEVYLKLEMLNPGASMKDRIALQIIRDAEADGRLRPGGTVVELTSGNTGTGLALVCAARGYRFIAVMSEGNSEERVRMMRALGARVVLAPQTPGGRKGQVTGADLELVEEETQRITRRYRAFRADQFANPSNPDAHFRTTAKEIWQALGGKVDVFVMLAGTGGAFSGITRYLKKRNTAIQCVLLEPSGARHLAGKSVTNPAHKLQGGGYAMDLPLVDLSMVDAFMGVTDTQAIRAARRLARMEGILAGFSTGANVHAALTLARKARKGERIVTLACDSGMKYLSTDLFP